jgi:hypothetical protein
MRCSPRGAEQSRVEHFADIVVARAENGEIPFFATSSERGHGNVLARTIDLRARPNSKAVA